MADVHFSQAAGLKQTLNLEIAKIKLRADCNITLQATDVLQELQINKVNNQNFFFNETKILSYCHTQLIAGIWKHLLYIIKFFIDQNSAVLTVFTASSLKKKTH